MLLDSKTSTNRLLSWLRSAGINKITKQVPFDPFATSMRDFDDVYPHLEDIRAGNSPQMPDAKQRITDLKGAGLVEVGKLTQLGLRVADGWKKFSVEHEKENELARHIVFLGEAINLRVRRYLESQLYWKELVSKFGADHLIDNWDFLLAIGYLDIERDGIKAGNLLQAGKIQKIDLVAFVKKYAPDDEQALQGATKVQRAINGKVPRGRHRSTFALAMESLSIGHVKAMPFISKYGFPIRPTKWTSFKTQQLNKIEKILKHYTVKDSVGSLEDIAVDVVIIDIESPKNIDFSKVKTDPPAAKTKSKVVKGIAKKAGKTDYLKKAAYTEKVGKVGEEFVLEYEQYRLSKKPALVKKIEWVSKYDDTKGYDIASFEEDGTPRYIEVKSTVSGPQESFFISDNEIAAASQLGDNYKIYRVYNLGKNPQFFEIPNPIEKFIDWTPIVFKVNLR